MSHLKLELTFTTTRVIDLKTLINKGAVDKDVLIDAIRENDIEMIRDIVISLPGYSTSTFFSHELEDHTVAEETDKFIEIKLDDQSLIHNLEHEQN